MTATRNMRGQLFGLVVSALLLAEAYGLWRPQALGALPQPDLGPFSHYRLVVALLTAGAGVVVLLATLFRDRDGDAAQTHGQGRRPTAPEADSPSRARIHQALRPAARSPAAYAEPAGGVFPAPPAAPEPALPPLAAREPQPFAVPVEDIDELDPFPGLAPAPLPLPEPAPPPAAPAPVTRLELEPAPQQPAPHPEQAAPAPEPAALSPPDAPPAAPEAPPPEPSRGDRGRFLDLTDEALQYRAAGNREEALERLDAALAIARKRAAADPNDLVARRDLAAALTHVGEAHDQDGRLDAAIALHEESLAVRRHLADASGADPASLRGLSLGLERLADAREARGHRSRARDLFRLRLQLAERLAARSPGDADLAEAVASTRARIAELDRALAV